MDRFEAARAETWAPKPAEDFTAALGLPLASACWFAGLVDAVQEIVEAKSRASAARVHEPAVPGREADQFRPPAQNRPNRRLRLP